MADGDKKTATGTQSGSAAKAPVDVTDAAIKKVAELKTEENNPKLLLRVFITGGGCSGFQYGFTFDEQQNDDDMVFHQTASIDGKETDVDVAIDSMSFPYLIGATIDYKEDLQGSQFVIRNPNAKTTCGCGASFSI